MKKTICLLLTLTMTLCLFSGCGNKESEAEAPPAESEAEAVVEETLLPEETEAPEEKPPEVAPSADEVPTEEPVEQEPMLHVYELPIYEEPVDLTYYFSFPSFFLSFCDPQQDSVYFNTISERTGINIELVLATGEVASEQFGIMVASGEMPDLVYGFTSLYTNGVDSAIEEDIIVDINEYIEYAPCYDYWTREDEVKRSIVTSSGYIGGFYTVYDVGIYNAGVVVRQDWLDALELDAPNTIDEYHDVLTAFKNEMGADSALWFGFTGMDPHLSGAYGIDASFDVSSMNPKYPFHVVDGEVRFSVVTDEFKQYLTTLNQWYEEGLIDRDFYSTANVSSSSEAVEQHVLSGRTGIWIGGVEDSLAYPSITDEYGIQVAAMVDPVLNEGDVNHVGLNTARVASNCVSVNADCENIIAAIQWMDYQYSDAGSELNNWGVEGVGFDYDENGKKVKTDAIINGIGDTPAVVINALYTGGFQPSVKTLEATQASYNDLQVDMMAVWAEAADGLYLYPSGASMTSEENESFSSTIFDISTYVQENVPKFITGEKPLSEFEDFCGVVESMNSAQLVEIKQAAYDRYMR